MSRIIRNRDELFHLHFNGDPNLRDQNQIEVLRPTDSIIDNRRHENTMQDALDDSICKLELDGTILFTRMDQVLPAESIK